LNKRRNMSHLPDFKIHLIGFRLCEALGLDYFSLYEKAYSTKTNFGGNCLRGVGAKDWAKIEEQVTVPPLCNETLKLFLHSVSNINHATLVTVLEGEFTKLGYDVAEWWEADDPHYYAK
jgi:hypothetical protein